MERADPISNEIPTSISNVSTFATPNDRLPFLRKLEGLQLSEEEIDVLRKLLHRHDGQHSVSDELTSDPVEMPDERNGNDNSRPAQELGTKDENESFFEIS